MAGMHILFDGIGDGRLLDNAEIIRSFLIGVARVAKMHIVNGPTVHSFKDSGQPDAGLSGYAVIAESHIAIHTWPSTGEFSFDLYSCQPFDAVQVESYVALSLAVRTTQYFVVIQRPGRPSVRETMHELLGKA